MWIICPYLSPRVASSLTSSLSFGGYRLAKANVSQMDRVNLEALAFIACRLCKPTNQNIYNMHNMYYMQKIT